MPSRTVILNKITTGCLLNFSFLEVCLHLIASFTYNDTIFERIFNSNFSICILVFSMLNLHFSVNCKAFQRVLAFVIFQRIIFLLYECVVYRRVHLRGILSKLGHFLLLKRKFSHDPPTKSSSIYFVKCFLKS